MLVRDNKKSRLHRSRTENLTTVLFKLKPNVTAQQIAELKTVGAAMVGVIPGTCPHSANLPTGISLTGVYWERSFEV